MRNDKNENNYVYFCQQVNKKSQCYDLILVKIQENGTKDLQE